MTTVTDLRATAQRVLSDVADALARPTGFTRRASKRSSPPPTATGSTFRSDGA